MKETFHEHPHKDKEDLIPLEGGDRVDEATKTILERLDKDIRDHRQELRERDSSTLADTQEREKRYQKEAKEREERMTNLVQEIKADLKDFKTEIKADLKGLKTEIEADLKDFETEVKADLRDAKGDCRASRNTVIVLAVTVILGIAGLFLR